MHTAAYDDILSQLKAGELRRRAGLILRLLQDYPQGLDRANLVFGTDGYWPANLANDPKDRMNRETIRAMREQGIPVTATSGAAGYRLDASEDALLAMRDEYAARAARALETVAQIDRMIVHLHRGESLPDALPVEVKQLTLI
jgi:hypothetical protein